MKMKRNMYQKAISLLLCFVMLVSSSGMVYAAKGTEERTQALDGEGTAEHPWLIQSPEELAAIAALAEEDTSWLNGHYAVTEDLDMEGILYTPIGRTAAFTGVLDGRGHQIRNLVIETEENFTGLFANLRGTVKNLGIESGTITGKDKVGAFAGRTDSAALLNCYSKADISGGNDVGGLAGMFNNSTLENCFVLGSVTGAGATAGGLVGGANRSPNPNVPTTLKNSYTAAKVTGVNFVGNAYGYDETPFGYEVIVERVYYIGGGPGVGNYEERSGITAMSAEEMQSGALLEALNTENPEEYSIWVEGITGYPEFSDGMSEIGLVGLGTKQAPYKIRTPEDLAFMAAAVEQDAQYADDFYALERDLDMEGVSYTPIGKNNHFSGELDGRGHKISNFTITETDGQNTGLIAFLDGGTVKNLGIESGVVRGGGKVGAIAGRTMHASILNCYSKADVSGTGNDVGGLAGMFNNSTMENSFVLGTVTSESGISVGGLAGSANRSIDPSAACVFENCYSLASVSASADFGTVAGYDESVAGEHYQVTFTNVYYENGKKALGQNTRDELTAVATADFTNGTLIELLNANRREGYREWLEDNNGCPGFSGKVFIRTELSGEGTQDSPYLISDAADLAEMERVVNLSNEFAKAHYQMTASIDLEGTAFSGIGAQIAFQGVFDGGGHVVRHLDIYAASGTNIGFFCQAQGARIQNFGIESGRVQGGYKVGAIAGRISHTTIINCFNQALVKGFEDVGGLVGMLNNSDLLNSYNAGVVTGSKSLGGLAGSVCRSLDPEAEANVKNCYNLGRVHWGTYSGKIAGYVETGSNLAGYANLYYNKENLPDQPIGNIFTDPKADGITGITACAKEEMQGAAFAETMNAGAEEGYGAWQVGSDNRARLAACEEASEIDSFLSSIPDQPSVEDGTLVLPVSASGRYKAVLYGSDNRQVVDLEGSVYTPLTKQRVNLIYDICDTQKDNQIVARLERNVILDVDGTYPDAGQNAVPNVVPGLREWYGREGDFELSDTARIVAGGEEAVQAANMLKMFLEEMAGVTLDVVQEEAKTGDIVIRFAPNRYSELGEEGYLVDIGDQVVIEGASKIGMQYGGVSVAQILYQDETHSNLPKGVIRDYPEYEIRGGMFDVARRYFELDYVEEMAKYMAWFKMNTLHLHINEDGGLGGEYSSSFVVESKKYPVLNSLNTGYVWSQEDYRQMQKNVKQFGIDVITEIDTPGHATIFQKINPDIVNGSNLNLAQHYDACLAMIEDVFDEYLDGEDPVFQNAIVHIGTDESGNSNENMRRYINDLAQYCLSKERVEKVSFWGNQSLYFGSTVVDSKNLINQVWDSADQRVEQALEEGYQIINSTSNSMYIIPGNANGLHNGYVDMEAFYNTWGGTIDFNTNRQTNPCWIANRNYYCEYDLLRGNPQILGTLFCNWNDRSWASDSDIMDLMLSYVGVISEKCWYGDKDRFESGKEFKEAFEAVGDYGPDANPRKRVASKSSVIAEYDFEALTNGKAADKSNGYDAQVTNAVIELPEEGYQGGNALKLAKDSSISLPFDSVGYPYTVKFDLYLDGAQEDGAVLFSDDNCKFYLDYEGKGVGFTIGKYGFTFNASIPENEWAEVVLSSVYTHGASATTILKINGALYNPSMITHPASVASHSATSYLGTGRMFEGILGYLDNLVIGNKYNQIFGDGSEVILKGEGTEESPYRIRNAEELMCFSNEINAGNKTEAYFKIEKDLDMAGKHYIPASVFKGVLDGGGHVVSNLSIRQPEGENVGLIGLLEGGTVKNLGILDATVEGKSRVAAIAGRTMYAKMQNCFAKAAVSGEWDCGVLAGMYNNSEMYNCYASGSVRASKETGGGLVGAANRSLNPARETVIENCYSLVELDVTRFGGAVAGYHEGNIQVNGSYPYAVTYTNVFYDAAQTAIGNDETNSAVTGLEKSAFTDGTLLELLNDGLKDGYTEWREGSEGPELLREASLAEAVAAAKEAQKAAEEAQKSAEDAQKAAEDAEIKAKQAQKDAEGAKGQALYAAQKAEDAKKAAVDAAQSAAGDKTFIEQAKIDAQRAQEAAETAKRNAVTAEENAKTAEAEAQKAWGEADKAKTAAVNAKNAAEDAKKAAVDASVDAQEAKRQAEAAREEANTAKTAAQDARDKASSYQQAAKAEKEAAQAQANLADASAKAAKASEEAAKASEKAAKEAQLAAEEALRKARLEAEELLKAAQKEADETLRHADGLQQKLAKLYAKKDFKAKKAALKRVVSTKSGQIKVTWKNIKGADGYVIRYAVKSNPSDEKSVKAKEGQFGVKTIKKLQSGKTYVVKIRAYKYFDGKKVYSTISAKKKIRVK